MNRIKQDALSNTQPMSFHCCSRFVALLMLFHMIIVKFSGFSISDIQSASRWHVDRSVLPRLRTGCSTRFVFFVFNLYEIINIVSAIFISEEELLFSSEESSLPDRPRDLTSCASLPLILFLRNRLKYALTYNEDLQAAPDQDRWSCSY